MVFAAAWLLACALAWLPASARTVLELDAARQPVAATWFLIARLEAPLAKVSPGSKRAVFTLKT